GNCATIVRLQILNNTNSPCSRPGLVVFAGVAFELGELLAQSDAVHLRLAGEDGGTTVEAPEQMAEHGGFDGVVHFAVADAFAQTVVEPRGEDGFEVRGGRFAPGGMEIARQVVWEEEAARGNGDGVFEDVTQFADVAGPGMALEEFQRRRRELDGT